jgi:hypothetical protein
VPCEIVELIINHAPIVPQSRVHQPPHRLLNFSLNWATDVMIRVCKHTFWWLCPSLEMDNMAREEKVMSRLRADWREKTLEWLQGRRLMIKRMRIWSSSR